MREIKFRAWHKGLKAMLYPPNGIDSMPYCRDSKGEHRFIYITDLLNHRKKKCPLVAGMTWDGRWYIEGEYQDVEWMQFTGLKDKNGKEIYEGDICNEGSVVQFVENGYLLMYRDGKFEDLVSCLDEVIGNIYENPELVKMEIE